MWPKPVRKDTQSRNFRFNRMNAQFVVFHMVVGFFFSSVFVVDMFCIREDSRNRCCSSKCTYLRLNRFRFDIHLTSIVSIRMSSVPESGTISISKTEVFFDVHFFFIFVHLIIYLLFQFLFSTLPCCCFCWFYFSPSKCG